MSRATKLAGSLARGLNAVLGARVGARVGVLAYHRVQPLTPGLPEPSFNVTPEVFREQLAGLKARGFRFVRLGEVLAAQRSGKSLPARSVVVTFDDAFASVHDHALSVLRELEVPAVAFLATAYLNSSSPFPFDRWGQKHVGTAPAESYRPLSVVQCLDMAASGLVELGAHTHTHQDFRGRPDDLQRDLKQSVDIVRDLFGDGEVAFAFPYGKTDLGYAGGAMSQAARDAGTCCALTTDTVTIDPAKDDPYLWGRFCCNAWDTSATVAAKLAGWYGWATQVQGWVDRARGFDRSVTFDAPLFDASGLEPGRLEAAPPDSDQFAAADYAPSNATAAATAEGGRHG